VIAISSRLGVWGFVVAVLPALAEVAGAPMSPGLGGALASGGLVSSGLGTAVASVWVWRSLPRRLSALKLAAGAGAPLGAAFVLAGFALRRPLSDLANAVDAAGPLVLALAVVAVGLLIFALVRGGPVGRP
jgi:hypothetical protein